MNIVIFLLLITICMGLVYLVHKYFGKVEFYILGIIYSVVAFLMSFKLINILGFDINANIIFNSGLILILYYFVNRYNEGESRRFIFTMFGCSLTFMSLFMITTFMIPSIYDNMSSFYQTIILDNIPIIILYPISFLVTMILGEYCFKELKKETTKRNIKTIFTIFGIAFIDVAIFIYFSYAFIIKFDDAIMIAIDNYLVKVGIMILYVLIVNRLFMVRKVK